MNGKKIPEFCILLVDDEPSWLRTLSIALERSAGFSNILTTSDSRNVEAILEKNDIGIVILDFNMPERSGEDILKFITTEYPEILVLILSDMNQTDPAVECMKNGAWDCIVKTRTEERLVSLIKILVRQCRLERENRYIKGLFLPGSPEDPGAFSEMITQNSFMLSVFGYIEAVSKTSQPVLITGESGTGKELAARAVHRLSRNGLPVVMVNVAGLDDTMFADTLFGHTKGAFKGAEQCRMGLIEKAEGGTIFLDEIGDLSPASQVKLLRLIKEGEYYPAGSDIPRYSPARIVCSTHQDLLKKEKEGEYRKDLYYRLHTHHIHMPPLRERKDDIPLLLDHFISLACRETGNRVALYPKELIDLLSAFDFPGNIRQLKAMVYDAVSTHSGRMLSTQTFKKNMGVYRNEAMEKVIKEEGDRENPFTAMPELPTLSLASKLLVSEAMERSGGNQSIAAKLIGISQPALSKRLKQMK